MELNSRINELRQRMISLALKVGFTSPDVVAISQELDKLIYEKMEESKYANI